MTSLISWVFGALSASLFTAFSLNLRSSPDRFALSLHHRTEVFYPGSAQFANASIRWNAAQTPNFDAIVKVATEEDIQNTILYANSNNKSFFAISGGHGTTTTVSNLKNGIGILLQSMTNITIVDDGHAALMEGGVQTGDVIPYLWSQGKQTTTTGCDCVGYIAPIIGGGHGWLQGRYGLASDQLISARLVLANGTAITVSEDEHNDLFWAIKGAGHNFGIVSQVKMKIYHREPKQDQWAASGFIFTHDKMEKVFALANEWLESHDRPIGMVHYGLFAHNVDVDPVNPIVVMWIYYQASTIPAEYTDPLYALSPINVESSVTDLAGVNTHIQATRDGVSCAKGFSRTLTPVSLNRYSLPSLRKVLDIFGTLPAEYRSSVMMLEGFPTNRVDQIPSEESAFPDRNGRLLLSPLLTYAANTSLDAAAWKIGNDIRDALLEGSGEKLRAYVNYARGDETMEEIYGHEPWRLEKLRRLKREYDPFRRFNFMAPITLDDDENGNVD